MFKAPFSFDGRIRRIEYFLSYLIAGLISGLDLGSFICRIDGRLYAWFYLDDGWRNSLWCIDRNRGLCCYALVLFGSRGQAFA